MVPNVQVIPGVVLDVAANSLVEGAMVPLMKNAIGRRLTRFVSTANTNVNNSQPMAREIMKSERWLLMIKTRYQGIVKRKHRGVMYSGPCRSAIYPTIAPARKQNINMVFVGSARLSRLTEQSRDNCRQINCIMRRWLGQTLCVLNENKVTNLDRLSTSQVPIYPRV